MDTDLVEDSLGERIENRCDGFKAQTFLDNDILLDPNAPIETDVKPNLFYLFFADCLLGWRTRRMFYAEDE